MNERDSEINNLVRYSFPSEGAGWSGVAETQGNAVTAEMEQAHEMVRILTSIVKSLSIDKKTP